MWKQRSRLGYQPDHLCKRFLASPVLFNTRRHIFPIKTASLESSLGQSFSRSTSLKQFSLHRLASALSDILDSGLPMAGHHFPPKHLAGLRACHLGRQQVHLDSVVLWTMPRRSKHWNAFVAGLESGYKERLYFGSRIQTWVPFCLSNKFLWATYAEGTIYIVDVEGRNYHTHTPGARLKSKGRLWKHQKNYFFRFQHTIRPSFFFIFSTKSWDCLLARAWLTSYLYLQKISPRLLDYQSFSRIYSTFNFLRYFGPRRLRPSRRVLVDGDEYQIMHVGRGAFATITRVLHKPTGDMRVMKRIVFDKAADLAKSLAEAEINTLKAVAGSVWFPVLLNHFKDDEEYIITMPFYRRGDMAGLTEHKGFLGRELARFYCAQLILAIQSLHKQGITHRDIKPDNIFLDESGHLILADFGLAENIGTFDGDGEEEKEKFPNWLEAKAKGGDDYPLLWVDGNNPLGTRGIGGTFWYTAPEVFRNERYSFGVDYYSVGVIYYELITGHIPFNNFEPYPETKRPLVDFRQKPGQVKNLDTWEKEAISKILASNPRDRPQTVTELKKGPLFFGLNWERMIAREILPPPLPLALQESSPPLGSRDYGL